MTGRHTHFDMFEISDETITYDLSHFVKFRPASLFGTDLYDPIRFPDYFAEYPAFFHREGKRFLNEDVFSGPGRHDSDLDVPMVRSTDTNSIYVLPVNDVPEIIRQH
jgi:hypothetical protein